MTLDFTFCPRCGAPLAEKIAFGRVRRACRYCEFIQFKDPKVAVAALVHDGVCILLVRRAVAPGNGLWALPAGYMDQDEVPEDAARREVLEETGVIVRLGALHRVVSLGGWQERRGIMLVYHAEAIGGQMSAADDASEAHWFTSEDVPWERLAFESTAELLREWVAGLPLQ